VLKEAKLSLLNLSIF